MSYPRNRERAAPRTMPLEDVTLSEKVSVFHAPRASDLALLGVLVAVLLGNGAWLWVKMGLDSVAGRAVFFGMALLCVYWCAVVYIFKLSLAVCVSPSGLSVVRGPWTVEIRWSELTRLMERMQPLDGRRYRWVVAIARDGRRISVREDAIGDYARFRREAYERYRIWRDHGGTWGATGSGPFMASETVRSEARWWAVIAVMLALPGVYFAILLPATNPLGYALFLLALLCLGALALAFLRRRRYTVDQRGVEARSMLKRSRLTWGQVTKAERTRTRVGGVILTGVSLGRLAIRLASRGDTGIRSFAWSPRVPEYLTLRGGGRQARIRLHRLSQPDELIAWVEFYDQVRGSGSGQRPRPQSAPTSGPLSQPRAAAASGPLSQPISASETFTPDMSAPSGPLDPWGSGRQGEPAPASQPRATTTPRFTAPSLPDLDNAPRPWGDVEAGVRFVDADNPSESTVRAAGASDEDAWLRETNALNRIERSPRDDAPDAGNAAYTPAEPARPAEPIWPAEPARPTEPARPAEPIWSAEPARPAEPARTVESVWSAEPVPPVEPSQPAAPRTPSQGPRPAPAPDEQVPWRFRRPGRAGPGQPAQPAAPRHDTRREEPTPATPPAPGMPAPDDGWANQADGHDDHDAYDDSDVEHDKREWDEGEELETAELESAPWRDENWQRPQLPRFGPSHDESPDHQ
ncbi:MAG TPA: hypothetical protein VF725_07325 [Ktedonobacterales bacterium]